jgi:ribosomal protein S17E
MPKVVSGVQGAKEFATEGKVQVIPDVTNRQGARKQLTLAAEKTAEAVVAALKPTEGAAPAQESAKPAEVVGQKPPEQAPPATETAEDPNEGVDPADMDLAERARKSIARKHRELKQAQGQLGKLQIDLADTENFSKAQFQRAEQALERVQTLERELSELKSQALKPAPVETSKKPDSKDPKYYENGQFKLAEYTEDVGKWSAQEALNEKAKKDAQEAERQQQALFEQNKKAAQELMEKRKAAQSKDYPDWDKVVSEAPEVRMRNEVLGYIAMNQDVGHITYYLLKNPAEVERLNGMHPLDAIAELGELRGKWKKKPAEESKKEPERQAAPAPISVLPGSGSVGINTDPSKMTPAQLRAYDREKAIAKRAAR